jgi:CDP-diacylglycerol--serine O-phosphatidyltransferase
MSIKKFIPNFLTSINLILGCLSIFASFQPDGIIDAAYFILFATVFDFADGFAARKLDAQSAMGKELDSMADLITFGVAPGLILFRIMHPEFLSFYGNNLWETLLKSTPALVPLFSALRLAKFNIDPRQTDTFIGLPTPANAIFICSLPLIDYQNPWNLSQIIHSEWFIPLVCLVNSLLLVSEIPLFSLKISHFQWKNNEIRYIFLIISAIFVLVFQYLGLALIILLYVLLSVIKNTLNFCHKG